MVNQGNQNDNRDNRANSRHRSPNSTSNLNFKPYYDTSNFKPPSRAGSTYPSLQNFQNKPKFTIKTNYRSNSRAQSANYIREGNRSPQPFSCNRFRKVRKYIKSLLDQKQQMTQRLIMNKLKHKMFQNNNVWNSNFMIYS